MLSAPALDSRPDAPIEGLEVTDTEWSLDTDRYRPFIESVTGVRVDGEVSASDCYRIGNRLEGLIDERRRQDRWTADLVAELPVVESREEVLWLARFFRHCHDCCLETGEPPS
jgi:hypothetical protein